MFQSENAIPIFKPSRQRSFFSVFIVLFCCTVAMLLPSCKDDDPVVAPTPEVKKEKEVVITAISPNTARAGDTITIQGRYFSEVTTNNVVVFVPDVQGIVLSSSTTGIVVVVPIGAQSGKVTVKVGEQTAESPQRMEVLQREVDELSITSISPSRVHVGETVTIQGRYFSEITTNNVVVFVPDVQGIVLSSSTTEIVIVVPIGAESGKVKVKVGGQTAESPQGVEILQREVQIMSFVPEAVTIGDVLTIYGSGFSPISLENIVTIGGLQVKVDNAWSTRIQCIVPKGCTTDFITVKVLGGEGKSSKVVQVLPSLLPQKNCIVEISGIRVKKHTHTTTTFFPSGEIEEKDTAIWEDFFLAIDTRVQTGDPDYPSNFTKRFQGNNYRFQNVRRQTDKPGTWYISIDIDPDTYFIRLLDIGFGYSRSSMGHTASSSNETRSITVGSIEQSWNSEHEYRLLPDSFRNTILSMEWTGGGSSRQPGFASYQSNYSIKEFVVTDSAKISIKFVD